MRKRLLSVMLTVLIALPALFFSGSPAFAAKNKAMTAAGPAAEQSFTRFLKNGNSLWCLVARYGLDGPIQQTPCDIFYPDQRWEQIPTAAGSVYFQLRNVRWKEQNLCLVIRGGSESPATLAQCNKNYNDQVFWESQVSGTYATQIGAVTHSPALCLTARNFDNAIKTTCNGAFADQRWLVG
jgi:hypothetical protein